MVATRVEGPRQISLVAVCRVPHPLVRAGCHILSGRPKIRVRVRLPVHRVVVDRLVARQHPLSMARAARRRHRDDSPRLVVLLARSDRSNECGTKTRTQLALESDFGRTIHRRTGNAETDCQPGANRNREREARRLGRVSRAETRQPHRRRDVRHRLGDNPSEVSLEATHRSRLGFVRRRGGSLVHARTARRKRSRGLFRCHKWRGSLVARNERALLRANRRSGAAFDAHNRWKQTLRARCDGQPHLP